LKYNESVSHYTQSLRFRKVEYRRDDETYYEMSQIYRKMGLFDGYIRALESAFTLNPEKYDYSLELGTSLSKTARRKKSLFHVERYIQNAPGTVPPELYLLAGNLNEDLGYYLETQKYYLKYLSIKGDDGVMHFALGYVAYARTGNHALARESFTRALELLPAGDLYRRSKCHEYSGDMALNDLRYRNAIGDYMETLAYQEKVKSEIDATGKKLAALKSRINAIKTDLLNRQDYEKFEEYELLEDERGKMELALKKQKHDYETLNAGVVRWNLAWSHERLEEYQKAIEFYRASIAFDYRTNDAREKIIKLQLKLKRGY
jgi:tetratricopeptide (TPR) repeat protein